MMLLDSILSARPAILLHVEAAFALLVTSRCFSDGNSANYLYSRMFCYGIRRIALT